jgi:hypothetical protein
MTSGRQGGVCLGLLLQAWHWNNGGRCTDASNKEDRNGLHRQWFRSCMARPGRCRECGRADYYVTRNACLVLGGECGAANTASANIDLVSRLSTLSLRCPNGESGGTIGWHRNDRAGRMDLDDEAGGTSRGGFPSLDLHRGEGVIPVRSDAPPPLAVIPHFSNLPCTPLVIFCAHIAREPPYTSSNQALNLSCDHGDHGGQGRP